jgi:hypothetical protein
VLEHSGQTAPLAANDPLLTSVAARLAMPLGWDIDAVTEP